MQSIIAKSAALNAFNLTPEQEREVAKRERAMWDIHYSKAKEDTKHRLAAANATEIGGKREPWTYGTIKRWYAEWENNGHAISALINKKWIKVGGKPTNPWIDVFANYEEDNKNASMSGWNAMMRDFWDGKYIEGIGTAIMVWRAERGDEEMPSSFVGWVPRGAGYANLMAYRKADPHRGYQLALNRQGSQAAQKYILPVLKSRGLFKDPRTGEIRTVEAGEIRQYDDVWHNIDVWFRTAGELLQPLEFAGWDVGSGYKCSSLMKPRFKKIDQKTGRMSHDNLKEQQFRFLFAHDHIKLGFSPRGIVNILEHGTTRISAKVYEQIRGIPYYGELIRIQTSGILSEQARVSMFEGLGGGNFRMKAFIESEHNKLHNLTAHLIGNRGRDAAHMHESHGNLVKAANMVLAEAERVIPEALTKIENGLALTYEQYSTLFYALEWEYMNRRDHKLEGWDTHTIEQYRLSAALDWQSEAEFLNDLKAYDPSERATITKAVMAKPGVLCRHVKMTRKEVWDEGAAKFIRVPMKYMVQFLDWEQDGMTLTVTDSHLLQFSNKIYYGNDVQQYKAALRRADGMIDELAPGRKVRVFANPLVRECVWVCDLETRELLGMAPFYAKASMVDEEAQKIALGEQSSWIAAAKRPMRGRHQKDDYRLITERTNFIKTVESARQGAELPESRRERVSFAEPKREAIPVMVEEKPADVMEMERLYSSFVGA